MSTLPIADPELDEKIAAAESFIREELARARGGRPLSTPLSQTTQPWWWAEGAGGDGVGFFRVLG